MKKVSKKKVKFWSSWFNSASLSYELGIVLLIVVLLLMKYL